VELNQRPIPEAALRDKDAVEMLRVWIAGNGLHCSLKVGMYGETTNPDSGWRGVAGSIGSPVMSYIRTDSSGNAVVVNVTQPGHPLHPGVVVRGVVTKNGQSVVHNVGEGTAPLQSYGRLSDRLINDVWIRQSDQNIKDAE